jgi:hypothetical protein
MGEGEEIRMEWEEKDVPRVLTLPINAATTRNQIHFPFHTDRKKPTAAQP